MSRDYRNWCCVNYLNSVVNGDFPVLLKDGFDDNPWFHSLVAEEIQTSNSHIGKKKVVGYALYFHAYSTWQGRMLYLEDLFVEPTSRGMDTIVQYGN